MSIEARWVITPAGVNALQVRERVSQDIVTDWVTVKMVAWEEVDDCDRININSDLDLGIDSDKIYL